MTISKAPAPPHQTLIAALDARLKAAATAKCRSFWEKYLKGAVPFRGVSMGDIRRAIHAWWAEDGPDALSLSEKKSLALSLFDGAYCEDKLAGTLVLQEILLAELDAADVSRIGKLFDAGLIADWNTCDWFCVKVLGSLVARHLPQREMADSLAGWRTSEVLWKRRASNVAFVNLAKRGDRNFAGFSALMFETCAVTVRSPERFAQTGVGWLLRELAAADRDGVLAFTHENLRLMSREGVRYVIERMPAAMQAQVLKEHGRRKQ